MKAALHFIWSPFIFAMLGFAIAWRISDVWPREVYHSSQSVQMMGLKYPEFAYFLLIALPAAGLVIGWILAYLSTPISQEQSTDSHGDFR